MDLGLHRVRSLPASKAGPEWPKRKVGLFFSHGELSLPTSSMSGRPVAGAGHRLPGPPVAHDGVHAVPGGIDVAGRPPQGCAESGRPLPGASHHTGRASRDRPPGGLQALSILRRRRHQGICARVRWGPASHHFGMKAAQVVLQIVDCPTGVSLASCSSCQRTS